MQIGTAIRIRVSRSRFIESIINTANIYQRAQKIFDAREVSSSFPSSSSSTTRYMYTHRLLCVSKGGSRGPRAQYDI